MCSTQGKAILLQTARTVVYNPSKPKQMVEIRIRFDSGSQKSCLTERVLKLLQLKPTGEQTLSIAAFCATQEQTKVCPTVDYPNATLSMYVVPTICKPLSCQPITASVKANDHWISADSADGSSCLPVDILVGCDHYWELATGGVCRSENGPAAIHTKLGCGPTPIRDVGVHSSTCVVTTHMLQVDSQLADSTQLTEQLCSF